MRKRDRVRDQDLMGAPHQLAVSFFLLDLFFLPRLWKKSFHTFLKQLTREEERLASLEGSSDWRRKRSSGANKGDKRHYSQSPCHRLAYGSEQRHPDPHPLYMYRHSGVDICIGIRVYGCRYIYLYEERRGEGKKNLATYLFMSCVYTWVCVLYTCMCTCICLRVRVCMYIHICIHTNLDTYNHIHRHANIWVYTYIFIYI